MARQAPNPIDVQDFQFKLHCRLNIFSNTDNSVFNTPCNLLGNSSRFGLLFVGTASSNFQVIQIVTVEKNSQKEVESNQYNRRIISTPSPPKHLSVNCDGTRLAVVIEKNACPFALIYEISSFLKQTVVITQEIRLSPSATYVKETTWNPTVPNIFTACKSDGTVGLYELKDTGIEIKELPAESQASCICWSPKGKQLAVGSSLGKITQYKPDLKAMKAVNQPPLEGPQVVLAVQWISSFQFIALYKSTNTETCALFVVDAPKVGDVIYTNYEDICYSYGNVRPIQFYTIHQSIWNILVVASSNSMEVGVLGNEKEQWTQWILSDVARAELPLSSNKQETLPVGLALDTSGIDPIIWGEHSLPPAPFLFLLSHYGVLCCFKMINIKSGVSSICHAPEPFPDNSGLSFFTKDTNAEIKFGIPKVEPLKESITTKSPTTFPAKPSLFASPPISLLESSTWQKMGNINAPSKLLQEETDLLLSKLIRQECEIFEKELQALLNKGSSLKIHLGTDSEAVRLVQDADSMQNFLKEVVENSGIQAAEVHSLKQGLIQTWAWYEDARSRYTQSQEATLDTLLRIQQLDPVSQRRLSNIQYLTYYLESQLIQANRALDEQWENFQDSCKKTSKLKIPTIETIYQTMVRQNAIHQKQKYPLFVSLNNVDQLERDLLQLQLDPENLLYAQYERVVETQKKLTRTKVKKLGNLLLERDITHIAVNKPQLSNTSLQTLLNTSAQLRKNDETILGAALSPIPSNKLTSTHNSDVIQSTPKTITTERKKDEGTFKAILTKPESKPNDDVTINAVVTSTTTSTSNLTQPFNFSSSSTSLSVTANISSPIFSFSKPTAAVQAKTDTVTTSVFQFTPASTSVMPQFSLPSTSSLFSLFTSTEPFVSSNFTSTTIAESKPLPTTVSSAFVPTTQLTFAFTAKSDNTSLTSTTAVKPSPAFNFSVPATGIVGKTEPLQTKVSSPKTVATTTSTSTLFKFTSPKTTTVTNTTAGISVFNFKSPVSISSTLTPAAVTVTPVSLQINTTNKSALSPETVPVQVASTSIGTNSAFGFSSAATVQNSVFTFKPSVSQPTLGQQTAFEFSNATNDKLKTPIFSSIVKTVTTTSGAAVTTSVKSIFSPVMTTSADTSLVKERTFLDAAVTSTSSIFNNANVSTGSPLINPSTSAPIAFASPTPAASVTTTSSNLFPTTASNTSVSITPIFTSITTTSSDNTAAKSSTPSSTFSLPAVTEPMFGTSVTSSSSVFTPTAFSAASNSVFTQPTTTVFPQSTTISSSIFVQPVTTVTSSFSTSQPSIFGDTPTTTNSVFGTQKSSFESGSIFDKPAFGSTPTFGTSTAASTNIFATASTVPLFGSNTSIFGNSATAPSVFPQQSSTFSFSAAAANIPNSDTKFGFSKPFNFANTQQNVEGGAFSFNSLTMGVPNTNTTASSPMNSAFGQSSNANPFAKTVSQEQKPFGGGSLFGTPPSATSSSIFGGGASNSSPSFGQSNFGSSFGSPQPSGLFSGGTNQSVAQSGFGAFNQTPQKSPGFGGAPIFGGSPSGFGAPPTFGGTTSAFGATSSSFGKVFGDSSNTAASGQQQNSTFANLATQNTLGFGSLAQQSQPIQNQSPFSSNSSFSTWR
ncbi:hypothetical protein RI129_004918 [Pyrocoelia pectoralis]|uniref:Nucleoporin Nup159/Nup146 N-terminal domain-containing protein n=1 Tax=Pyrocoelia pectoralis TaxID=417401 RepID=A0AAN7VLT3_9COLE